MYSGLKEIRPEYESEVFEVFEVSFGDVKVVSVRGNASNSIMCMLVLAAMFVCTSVVWAMNESPWPAVAICGMAVGLCVFGVLFDHFNKAREEDGEEICPDPSRFESEVSGQTRTIERHDGHDSLRGPTEGTGPLRSDNRGEGEGREDHHPTRDG